MSAGALPAGAGALTSGADQIRAWPSMCVCVSLGIVMFELVLDTQWLTHQSTMVLNGFGHVCSYQDYTNHC